MTLDKWWDLWIKSIALVGAIVGAGWTIYTYVDSKEKEFYSVFWNRKMDLYINVSEAASILATTDSLDEFIKRRAEFWGFFYGRLSIVEDDSVKVAMEAFTAYFPHEEIPQKLPLGIGHQAYVLSLAL